MKRKERLRMAAIFPTPRLVEALLSYYLFNHKRSSYAASKTEWSLPHFSGGSRESWRWWTVPLFLCLNFTVSPFFSPKSCYPWRSWKLFWAWWIARVPSRSSCAPSPRLPESLSDCYFWLSLAESATPGTFPLRSCIPKLFFIIFKKEELPWSYQEWFGVRLVHRKCVPLEK